MSHIWIPCLQLKTRCSQTMLIVAFSYSITSTRRYRKLQPTGDTECKRISINTNLSYLFFNQLQWKLCFASVFCRKQTTSLKLSGEKLKRKWQRISIVTFSKCGINFRNICNWLDFWRVRTNQKQGTFAELD